LKRSIRICIFLAFVLLAACRPPEHSFSADELKIIDSLYRIQKDSLELIMKEKCDSIFISDFQKTVDSLKLVRQKEILDIISK